MKTMAWGLGVSLGSISWEPASCLIPLAVIGIWIAFVLATRPGQSRPKEVIYTHHGDRLAAHHWPVCPTDKVELMPYSTSNGRVIYLGCDECGTVWFGLQCSQCEDPEYNGVVVRGALVTAARHRGHRR